MPKYKAGKQLDVLEFPQVLEKVEAQQKYLSREELAFFWLLYYGGMRKSELYERIVGDCQIKKKHFILDIPIRKKGSANTDPLEFPLWFPGMDIVCEQLEKARARKPIKKLLERWEGKKRITSRIRARWLFPQVHRSWAAVIVKKILGEKYYPHFLRLNRLTEIGSDPGANYVRMRSFSGIKSMRVIENSYMGKSKKEQKAAVDFIGKQINKNSPKSKSEELE